jgi:hypothetical protein
MTVKSVADIEGPWIESDFKSGLIERCKSYWTVPVDKLLDLMVATYLSQRIATAIMIEEAKRRVALGKPDDSELFDGQWNEALARAIAVSGHR